MANVKISDLPAASSAGGTDQLETNQGGVSRRLTVAQVATHVRSTATDTVVVAAGSAAAPSIAPTGDSNTGLFAPAADTLAFSTGGTERLRLDSSGNATFAGTAAMASSFLRNRIINGDMRIDQRNAGASVSLSPSTFPVDRWIAVEDTDGTATGQRSTVAPAGFTNSLLFTVTSADASLGASQFACILQYIEGFNTADLGWGSAAAQTVTLSFWARSSVTGTYGGSLRNGAANRSYPFTYSISAANTWEYKTVTVAGDTTGTWATDNSIGVAVIFGLGVGSTFSGTSGAWAGSNLLSATGATNLMATNGATFYLTGVQLEVGTAATPFERRLYGQELALCQRYYAKTYETATVPATLTTNGVIGGLTTSAGLAVVNFVFPVEMRAAPTVTLYNASTGATGTWRDGGAVDRAVSAGGLGTRQIYVLSSTATASTSLLGHAVAAIEL